MNSSDKLFQKKGKRERDIKARQYRVNICLLLQYYYTNYSN